jgi:catechol 2,3-dioxygenase
VSVQKVSHVELGVDDVAKAASFHKDVLGLYEIAAQADTVYLGCGQDDNYDIALSGGAPGLRCLSLEVEGDEDLVAFEKRLSELGIKTQEATDDAPGVARSLRFIAPSGHLFALNVDADRPAYTHPAGTLSKFGCRSGVAPIDLDHVTLLADDPPALIDFMRSALGFAVSDIFEPEPGHVIGGWTRANTYHHDVGILHSSRAGETLHHVALQMHSIDHIRHGADQLSIVDVPIEVGPVRHAVGGNISAYFWAPGGNRYELSSDMARASSGRTDPKLWTDLKRAFSLWGQPAPETFYAGS